MKNGSRLKKNNNCAILMDFKLSLKCVFLNKLIYEIQLKTIICRSFYMNNTVKPAHEVTSIKQSPALKGQLFLVKSLKIPYELHLF